MNLNNKIVLITGSSIGIGRETAYVFAKEGCKVIITYYKDKKEAEEAAKRCFDLGAPEVLVTQLNIMDDLSIKHLVNETIEKFSEISVLINNAGIVVDKYLKDQAFQEIEEQIRTNLEGLIKVTKECLPYIRNVIVNIGSVAALEGYQNLTTYCATKFGVRGFSMALSKELPHIKVFSVHPGVTATRMNDFQGMPPEKVANVILKTVKNSNRIESGKDVKILEEVDS